MAVAFHYLSILSTRQPLKSFLDSINRRQVKIWTDGKNYITRTGKKFVMQAKIFSYDPLDPISMNSTTNASVYTDS